MEIALRLKFTQHPDLKALLLGTGDADLVEVGRVRAFSPALAFILSYQDSPRDYFWGIGADQSGRNELGKALVRLRGELREEQDNPSQIPTARRDTTRLSVQDLTSLAPTASVSNVNTQRFSVASVVGGGLAGPQIASLQGSGLCEV